MKGRPTFHLQRVDVDHEGPVEVHPVGVPPEDAHLERRGFLGAGIGIASVLASLGSSRTAEAAPKGVGSSPP